jgi:protein-tyrosine phosphatase
MIPAPTAAFQVDWLKLGGAPLLHTPGRLALSACPGWMSGDLGADLEVLKTSRISTVISLVDEVEMRRYGVADLADVLAAAGVRHLCHPLVDGMPPADVRETRQLCQVLLARLGEGESLLIHCIGGWGRSGTIAACLLCHEGYSAQKAIGLVRHVRHPRCVETLAQEIFVQRYARQQQLYERRYHFVRRQDVGGLLSGGPGERRLRPPGGEGFTAVPADQLPQALLYLHRGGVPMVALSGEVAREGARPELLPVDRAYQIDGDGLLPVPMGSLL